MRSTLIGILFSLASLLLAATANGADEVSAIDVCRDYSLIARDVMTARQKSEPMSETLPLTIDRLKRWADKYGLDVDSETTESDAALLVMAAYDESAEPTDRHVKLAISDFENRFFKNCYEALTSD